MNTNLEKAEEILNRLSNGVLVRICVTVEHFPIFKEFGHGSTIGKYTYWGSNDNGQQVWKRNTIENDEFRAMKKALKLTNSKIAEIIGLTEDSVKTMTQPARELPTWAKAMLYIWKNK